MHTRRASSLRAIRVSYRSGLGYILLLFQNPKRRDIVRYFLIHDNSGWAEVTKDEYRVSSCANRATIDSESFVSIVARHINLDSLAEILHMK